MRRLTAAVVICTVIASATPAPAADEPEDATPSTGGPVVTIPIDAGRISELVIADVVLRPETGVASGGSVRLTGLLAAGATPDRIVVVIDGTREAAGTVEPAADGSIDHTITLPSDLAPGRHTLSLRAEGLGIAPLGAIEVAAPAPTTVPPATTEAPAPPDPSGLPSAGIPQQAGSPESAGEASGTDTSGSLRLPLLLALAAAAAVAVAATRWLRRKRRIGHIGAAASLPTATRVPGRPPATTPPEDAPTAAGAAASPAPPAGAAAPAAGEPTTSSDGAAARTAEHPTEPAAPAEPAFLVVRLTVATGGDDTHPAEQVAAECRSFEHAKRAARNLRSGHEPSPGEEVWWEIRKPGQTAIWMLHAWAPREYDLDVDSGRAAPRSKG